MPAPTPPTPRLPFFDFAESDADQKSPSAMSSVVGEVNSTTRIFIVENTELYRNKVLPRTLKDAALAVLGWSDYTPSPAGALTRHLPMTDLDDTWQVATRMEVRGIGNRGDKSDLIDFLTGLPLEAGAEFERYALTVTFQVPEYDILADDQLTAPLGEAGRYVIVEEKPSLQFATMDAMALAWDPTDANNPVIKPGAGLENLGFGLGVPVYFEEIVLNWLQVPEAAINPLMESQLYNRVNQNTITLPNSRGAATNYPPQTILFAGATKGRRRRWDNGIPYRDLKLVYRFNAQGWQKALSSDGRFYRVIFDADPGRSLFEQTDLTQVFVGPPA